MKKHFQAMALAITLLVSSLNAVEVSLEGKISALYIAFFNRAADSDGLIYWTNLGEQAENSGEDISDVLKQLAVGFATHPTFTSTYSSMNSEDFVNAIYQNSLGMNGDSEGIAYWSSIINNGKSRSDMVAEFIDLSLTLDLTAENFPTLSQEELDAAILRQTLISNKVAVAIYFTNNLGTLTNITDSENPENTSAYLASIEILSDITTDNTTVNAAVNRLQELTGKSSAIAAIINDWQYVSSGSTSTLEDGPESLFSKCTGCHGENAEKKALGKSAIIAGRDLESLIADIKAYKAGTLDKYGMGSLMMEQVSELSDEDIDDVAKYINSLDSITNITQDTDTDTDTNTVIFID